MKQKDLIYGILAIAILAVAGYMLFTQVLPGNKPKTASTNTVESMTVISDKLDAAPTDAFAATPSTIKDYTVTIDLSTGLNNTEPFGK